MSQFAVIHSSGARAWKAAVAHCVVFEFKWHLVWDYNVPPRRLYKTVCLRADQAGEDDYTHQ